MQESNDVSMTRALVVAVLTLAVGAATSSAQSGSVDLKAVGGVGQFYLDESFPDHFEVGLAARVYLGPRWAVEPEFDYIESRVDFLPNEWKYTFLTSIVRRFGNPEGRARPYWLVGAGARFGGQAENVFLLTAGIGLHAHVSDRVFLAVEARFTRFTAGLGFTFGPTSE